MWEEFMDKFDLYRDIASRTGGDVYVGVVGPVRTGKSTILKQIMQKFIVDGIENDDERARAIDEIPQSADGKTIMTTQPRFVPNEAVKVQIGDNVSVNLRLIDCVGYVVSGALGAEEDGKERMVATPWSEENMPFSKAAEIGTEKVIKEHSTIALAVTTDGSFSGISREEYVPAEERAIAELKECGKPFVIVLNVKDETSESARALRAELEDKYSAPVILKNALSMDEDDISEIFESVLLEFAVKLIDFKLPRWVQSLDPSDEVVGELLDVVKSMGGQIVKMRDFEKLGDFFEGAEFWDAPTSTNIDAGTGKMSVNIAPKAEVFYKVLSRECGMDVEDDYALLKNMREMARDRQKTARLRDAMEQVDSLGYGIVLPTMDEIDLEEPEILRQGGQYGVRLKAHAPSLHVMKVDVEAEVSPIVGSEQQSRDMVDGMLADFEDNKQAIWDTNIFGRTLSSLVADGINNKLAKVPSDAEQKMRKTMGRIVNEGKGGVICILL